MNYKDLKLDEKGLLPTFNGLMPFVLKYISDGKDWYFKDLEQAVIRDLNVPHKLMKITLKSGRALPIDRVNWALTYLHNTGLIVRLETAHYLISSKGLSLLKAHPDYQSLYKVTTRMVKRYRKAKKTKKSQKRARHESAEDEKHSAESFSDDIYSRFRDHNEKLKQVLLAKIHSANPYFFEHVVLRLLEKMGYGKPVHTQNSRDGGIDGYIKADPLGTNVVYMQAKRYEKNNEVGVHAVRDFRGALDKETASKGVFITTSKYSNEAESYAHDVGIILVDGKQLASLMLKYQVGIHIQDTYHVFGIDNDFFD